MNRELFKQIYDIIKVNPKASLNMSEWESCGTTRCVAGWAIHLTTGKPLYARGNYDPSVVELARSLDVAADIEVIGASLLELDTTETNLFYSDEGTALEFVKLASEGKSDEARASLLDVVERW